MDVAEAAFFYIALGLAAGYAVLLSWFVYVLFAKKGVSDPCHERTTVVLPFKNEGVHLPDLIEHFGSCPHEVIFVNDHSSDLSHDQLEVLFRFSGISLHHLPEGLHGKKAALHFGVERARGQWILTSDADTRMDIKWLCGIHLPGDAAALVLPIAPVRGSTLWSHFFALEFLALQVAGCASARLRRPLLANGAAFLYRRAAYLGVAGGRSDWQEASGDDVFTLHAIAERGGEVDAITEWGPVAQASFPDDLTGLWRQRLRWVGKAGDIRSSWYKFVAWWVLLTNAAFVWAIWELVKGEGVLWLATVAFKIVGDICLLAGGVLYFRRSDLMWYIPFAIPVYPFYLLVLVTTSLWHRPKWK